MKTSIAMVLRTLHRIGTLALFIAVCLLISSPKALFAQAAAPTSGPSSSASYSRDTLWLKSDQDTTFDSEFKATALKSNGIVTLDANPMTTATDKILTLGKPVWIGFYTTLVVQSDNHFIVRLPTVTSNQPGGKIRPIGATVQIGWLNGDIALDGEGTGHTLGTYSGRTLQKVGTASWTITGDNAKSAWNTAVEEGELILARGATLGSAVVHVIGTFSARAETSIAAPLFMHDGSMLNLADGTIGTFTVNGVFSAPTAGRVTLQFDIDSTGVDQLILQDVSSTNDIKDYVVLHRVSKKLTPGTYTLVSLKSPGKTLMENHLAFDFTGDPADHRNMIMTKAEPDYTFTLAPVVDKAGNWTGYTLTVAETKAAAQAATQPLR